MRKIYCMFFAAILIVANCILTTQNIFAMTKTGDDSIIVVQSVDVYGATSRLNIDSKGSAHVGAVTRGRIGTSKIEMTVKLQKYNSKTEKWTSVKTWTKTVNAMSASLDKTYSLSGKGTYRCKVSAEVTRNGNTEKVTATSSKVVY